jgi:hypothetical protein
MHKTTRLKCVGCGKDFEKSLAEVKRQLKTNPDHPFYCELRCYALHAANHHLGDYLGKGDVARLNAGNRQDEYSAFKYFLNKARNRQKSKVWGYDIDLPYLRDLWLSQKGLCALSGLSIDLPRNTAAWEEGERNPWKASLDRIDSSKGYIKGNVQFVVAMANICKGVFRKEDVIKFCSAVAAHNPNPGLDPGSSE